MAEVRIVFNNAEFISLVHDPEIADVCEERADEIIREVRVRIHNVTGRSSRNLSVSRVRTEDGPAADVRTMWYLRFPDQGTKYIRPQHIIQSAIDAVADRL